jgi:hypothetical protein
MRLSGSNTQPLLSSEAERRRIIDATSKTTQIEQFSF